MSLSLQDLMKDSVSAALSLLEQLETIEGALSEWKTTSGRKRDAPIADDLGLALEYNELRINRADIEYELTEIAEDMVLRGFPQNIWVRCDTHMVLVEMVNTIQGQKMISRPRIRLRKSDA